MHTDTLPGRVGDTGQSALLGQGFLGDAETQFKKKFKDKTGLKWEDRMLPPKAGKYTWVEKVGFIISPNLLPIPACVF